MTAPKPRTKPAARQAPITYVMPPSNHDSSSTAVLEAKVDALVRQSTETNETLRSLTRAVTQLAVIEERQTADRAAVDRAFGEIKSVQTAVDKLERDTDGRISGLASSLDGRIKVLENKVPVNDLSNGILAKIGWLMVSAVIGAVLMLVLSRPAGQAPVFIQQAPATQPAKPAR